MAFLSKVTNLISFARNKVQLAEGAEAESTTVKSTVDQHIQYLRSSWKSQSEPLDHASFSLVDSLMAKTAFRAAREMSGAEDDAIIPGDDIDLTDVVMSIELQHERNTEQLSSTDHEDHDMLDNNDKIDVDDEALDLRAKYKAQKADCLDMMSQGWEQDTILAYLKLDRRGLEPLFPSSWKMDFVLFPPILFTDNEESAFVRSLSGQHWRAMHEFDTFCKAGVEVRVSQLHHTHPARRPEAILAKYIKQYVNWVLRDAGLDEDLRARRLPQLLTVMCAKYEEKDQHDRAELLQERLLRRLRPSGDDLLAILSSKEDKNEFLPFLGVPSLFGFAVVDDLVGVIAYEPLTRTARSIGFFNFDDRHVEVMNTVSLTIIIHWVRYSLLRLRQALIESGAPLLDGGNRYDHGRNRRLNSDDVDA